MRHAMKAGIATLLCLTFLSACGGLARTTQEANLPEWLQTLEEAKQHGEVGSVAGYLYLFLPGPPIPLRDWPVILIPLPTTLETTVAQSKERFLKAERAPLTAEALRQAQHPIVEHLKRLRAMGHSDLIKTVKTETGADPKFTFQDVPPGRWLLLAELPSTISVLRWAVPVTVTKGQQTWQSLNDKSLWLEGLKP